MTEDKKILNTYINKLKDINDILIKNSYLNKIEDLKIDLMLSIKVGHKVEEESIRDKLEPIIYFNSILEEIKNIINN